MEPRRQRFGCGTGGTITANRDGSYMLTVQG